jgi:hypothetical protein
MVPQNLYFILKINSFRKQKSLQFAEYVLNVSKWKRNSELIYSEIQIEEFGCK